MPGIMPAKLTQISQANDPKRAILDAIGDAVDDIEVFGSYLLVGTYIAPEKTAGGILLSDRSKMEDLFQGCLGLVLKTGPAVFIDDRDRAFFGQNADVGDWVMFRFSDAWEQHLNGVSVRWVPDVAIKAVIDDPAIITSRPRKG